MGVRLSLRSPRLACIRGTSSAKSRTRTFHPYTPGVLMLHSGHTLHQIAAVDKAYPDDERITLQAHGLHCDGGWTIYW